MYKNCQSCIINGAIINLLHFPNSFTGGKMGKIAYEINDRVAYISLNRPDKRNAIDLEMAQQLSDALSDARDNESVWAILIAGKGKDFCTGFDIDNLNSMIENSGNDKQTATGGRHIDIESPSELLYDFIQTIWKPTIVAIHGNCLAQGAGIALSCDIRMAATDALIGWPQSKLGIPSTSGPCVLAHQVPQNIALERLYTGEPFTAVEALQLHLVNFVVPAEKLLSEADSFIRIKILPNAPLAMRSMKEVTVKAKALSPKDAVLLARKLRSQIADSWDILEGLTAYKEKRQAKFKGK
jgi:enoyl-CoA hydratase/carnithine racemase